MQIKGELVESRRCHSASVLGNLMIVIGGINATEKYLSDILVLDLIQN